MLLVKKRNGYHRTVGGVFKIVVEHYTIWRVHTAIADIGIHIAAHAVCIIYRQHIKIVTQAFFLVTLNHTQIVQHPKSTALCGNNKIVVLDGKICDGNDG